MNSPAAIAPQLARIESEPFYQPVGDEVARMDHLLKAGHPNEWRALTAPSS